MALLADERVFPPWHGINVTWPKTNFIEYDTAAAFQYFKTHTFSPFGPAMLGPSENSQLNGKPLFSISAAVFAVLCNAMKLPP